MDSPDRADFLAGLKSGGKYEGTVGLYRHNVSTDRIGLFDREIIDALAATGTKWIAHNGAGYDQIDVLYCKEKGTSPAWPCCRASKLIPFQESGYRTPQGQSTTQRRRQHFTSSSPRCAATREQSARSAPADGSPRTRRARRTT